MKNLISLVACLLISACSMNAPIYQPSTNNSNLLQDVANKKLSVKPFTESNPQVNELSLRGGSLISPYNGSYSIYLTKALEEELKLAGIWDNNAKLQISGTLIDNQLDISGFSIGTASVTVKFVIKRGSKTLFNKKIKVDHQWESSFVGAVAIPAGQNNYPVMVQKLFAKLFKDKQFIRAVR